MNTLINPDLQRIGWTLLHSIWQGTVVFLLTYIILQFIPSRKSSIRYAITCIGLMIIVVCSAITFLVMDKTGEVTPIQSSISFNNNWLTQSTSSDTGQLSVLERISQVIEQNMPLLVWCWLIGASIFFVRLLSSWWYIQRIQNKAIIITDEANELLSEMCSRMGISRKVSLAESIKISSPVVVGYLKPIILLPVGMISGLTTHELEMIFVHELAHIRRHDYLINLIQALVESILFFNPFVWALSSLVRREREFCCDDMVLAKNGNALDYAKILVRLREQQLAHATNLAMSFTGEKNQLLNRIKRIMEKSSKHYSETTRLIPVVVIILGLLCASWLSIKDEEKTVNDEAQTISEASEEIAILPDTSIKKKQSTYRRMSVTTYDKNGEPHEEVVEEYDGDGDFDLGLREHPFNFNAPTPPDVITRFPSLPGFPSMPDVPMTPFMFNFKIDSIPHGMPWYDKEEWEHFSKEFEEQFRENFENFHEEHEKEIEALMEEMQRNFKHHDRGEGASPGPDFFEKFSHSFSEEQMRNLEKITSEMQKRALEMSTMIPHAPLAPLENMEELHDIIEHTRDHSSSFEKRMKEFESRLKDMLIEDGYINKGDKISEMEWDSDGEIEVNNQKIKKEHHAKYNDLHLRYFPKGGHFRYVE